MNPFNITINKFPAFVLFTVFAMMLLNGPAIAGDHSMQTNLNDLSEIMTKWSNQLSSGKMSPEAQEKLSELLNETSQVLRDLSAKSGNDMNTTHHMMIEKMKSEWDPFDTSDRM
jgi:hypothetical protein